jgi:hypothetical protein
MSDSEIEPMNSDSEEVAEQATVNTAPKPKKSKKSKKKKPKKVVESESSAEDSDIEPSSEDNKARKKHVKNLDTDVLSVLSDSSNDDIENTVNELKKEVTELKEQLRVIMNGLSVATGGTNTKSQKGPKNKKDKSYDLSELSHSQVQSLVVRKDNWGDHEVPEDEDEAKKVRITKPKLPSEIANKKLREFVTELINDDDLLDDLEIEIDDGKITTHQVTKLIKEHCKKNDGLVMKEIINKNGDTRKAAHYNLTDGDFEDIFEEYVSSD